MKVNDEDLADIVLVNQLFLCQDLLDAQIGFFAEAVADGDYTQAERRAVIARFLADGVERLEASRQEEKRRGRRKS